MVTSLQAVMPLVLIIVKKNIAELNLKSITRDDVETEVVCFGMENIMNDSTVYIGNHEIAGFGLVSSTDV